MHIAPLLPGHQRQLSHPLPLPRGPSLSVNNPHRRPVLRQHADRIAERCMTHNRGIWRDGDMILALNLQAQRFNGQFVKDVDV